MAAIQYNRVIRKLVVGFGNLFNEITLVRYMPDGTEAERFLIPIAYATKERYVMRLEDDLNLDKKVQVALPRFSFEMAGMRYDASRKQNTNTRNFAQTSSGVVGQFNPVPYDFDFKLYLYVRNIEDATQVLEHIIPYFAPDYTMKLNLVPEMGMVKEVPVLLNSADHEIVYEGDRNQETRMIIWTLSFTVKGFIFGKTTDVNTIKHSITSIYNMITPEQEVEFTIDAETGVGDYQIGETVYQGYNYTTATAQATVVYWNAQSQKLVLRNINGDFISSQPIYGINNSANYRFTSYNVSPYKYAQIDARVNEEPSVKIDDTEFSMDSSNTAITMDKVNTPSVTITEGQ